MLFDKQGKPAVTDNFTWFIIVALVGATNLTTVFMLLSLISVATVYVIAVVA